MEVCLKTYTRLKAYIINGIESGYTNGPMEANNNNKKVLKRIAYGYRNYTNFRNRILLVFSDRMPISM
ncbi:MAG: transposase [Clostridiaceae bacterium]